MKDLDPKEAETRKKMEVLAAYIEKQLASGTAPKDLYEELINRKAPHKLVVKMINEGLAKLNKAREQPATTDEERNAHKAEMRAFINAQANATVNKIRDQLIERGVSPEEAAALILEETGLAVSAPQAGTQVSPFLPNEISQAAMPPIENKNELLTYIYNRLSAGVGTMVLVDSLVENSIERNQAIDLVMDVNQKREAELREIATSPTGESKADLRKRGLRNMLIGGVISLAGSGLALVIILTAGNRIFYWLGSVPIILGLGLWVIGLLQWLRNR